MGAAIDLSCISSRFMPMRTFKAFVLATFALGVFLRVPTFGRPLLSDDEAIYATTADALARGDLLYRDVVDHKPPLIYHVYQAGFAAFGRYNTQGAHALVILSVLLTAGFLFAIKWREGSGPAPVAGLSSGVGLAAAGLFLVFSTTWHDYDALAANCELFLLAPQTIAAWLLFAARVDQARPRGARGWATHLAVGLLIGTSALFKYQGLTFLGASMGLLVWWVILGRASVEVGRGHGALSNSRLPGSACALSFVVRPRRQRRGGNLLVQVQFFVSPGRLDGIRGDCARLAPHGAHRWGRAGALRARRLGRGRRGVSHRSGDTPPLRRSAFGRYRGASAVGGAGPAAGWSALPSRWWPAAVSSDTTST